MARISRSHLEAQVNTINSLLGQPSTAYSKNGDRYTANVGNYHIGAYSPGDRYGTRYSLQQMTNEAGGVNVVYGTQVCGAEAFSDVLRAMISGIQAAQETSSRTKAA